MNNWKKTLSILWISNFIAVAGMSLIMPFLPLYIERLGVHKMSSVVQWSGWIFAAQMLTAAIFQPIWGAMADKYGRKPMLLRASIGMGVMTILMGLVTAPWQLLGLRLINGVFSGFISMSISLQASVTPDEESGQALGTLQTGQTAGTLIGPLIGGVLAELIGIRAVFIVTGVLLLGASAVVFFFVKENVAKKEREKRVIHKGTRKKIFLMLFPVFIATLITQLGMMSIQPILTIYTKTIYTGKHLETIAGLVVAVSGIATLIAAPILGKYSDRIGQKKILTFSLIMAALSFLPQVLAHNVVMLMIGRFLLGLFVGGMLPALNVLVKKHAPDELQAQAFGLSSSFKFMGNLLGPLLGSSVAAMYNIRYVFYITMIILLINATMIAFNKKLGKVPKHA
ncbi:MFS transporter [Pullulanibacillus sp. KACC 23026]|uniref:MFS transporter n=1 Tax=Pullulanibacillus sp. KACC 23026 TaxID=3028315 RepID=UPI0023AE9D8D|nr:MFS transporter [Pullulanibacillus sp. KACC 23026]WEG12420.1 MFS transporter [Pullulanibacillus sp. KACC 23026]